MLKSGPPDEVAALAMSGVAHQRMPVQIEDFMELIIQQGPWRLIGRIAHLVKERLLGALSGELSKSGRFVAPTLVGENTYSARTSIGRSRG